jgi:hypothetical protein
MGMFFFGSSKGVTTDDDLDEDDQALMKTLTKMRRINIESTWDNNRPDAFIKAIERFFNNLDVYVATSIKWERVPSADDPRYDDIKITIICKGETVNASFPLDALYHPECPQTLHEEMAKGLMAKLKKTLKDTNNQ